MAKETLLEFPTEFPIKALGPNQADFRELIIELVARHAQFAPETDVSEQPSRNGNYISITINFSAENQEQVDTIYQSLHDHEMVLMVF
jgi:putative lipoic acid-binding regulatory protein